MCRTLPPTQIFRAHPARPPRTRAPPPSSQTTIRSSCHKVCAPAAPEISRPLSAGKYLRAVSRRRASSPPRSAPQSLHSFPRLALLPPRPTPASPRRQHATWPSSVHVRNRSTNVFASLFPASAVFFSGLLPQETLFFPRKLWGVGPL